MTFEWDSRKARSNRAKHDIAFEEAATVFADPLSLTIPDPDHSQREDRYVTIGSTHRGKLVVVVHTARGDNIRLISARLANRKERQSYEQIDG